MKKGTIARLRSQSSKIAASLQARRAAITCSRMRPDLRLYAIVDPDHAGSHALPELARRVAEGGATLVQLRDKQSETRAMLERARAIKAALAPLRVPFI